MQSRFLLVFLGSLLAVSCLPSNARALMAPPPIAITASNLTMPSSGNGTSQYTITNIPAAGTVTIGCLYTGVPTTAKIPECTYPTPLVSVTAGQTLTGTIDFYPFGASVPMGLHKTQHGSGRLSAAGLAMAGALMLGFGFQRRTQRWLAMVLLAAGALAGLAGISACGGVSNAMTPGTYQYTITGTYADTVNPTQGAILDAPISVTVQ
jgi:hypothetical protein